MNTKRKSSTSSRFNTSNVNGTITCEHRKLMSRRHYAFWRHTGLDRCRSVRRGSLQNSRGRPGGAPARCLFRAVLFVGKEREEARLVASVRLERGAAQAPQIISLSSGTDTVWPLAQALTGTHYVLHHQERRDLSGGPWTEPVKTAAVLPLIEGGQGKPTGFLVVGASPLLAFDDDYQGFFDLLASSVASSIAKARALEDARKQAQALAEIDRAKTVFFSNVAHELRTPLTLILGPIEDAMAQGDRIAQDVRSELDVAHRNGLRLLRLINGMLDFSRIEAGRTDAVYERTDLALLTRDLASVFRSAIEKAGGGSHWRFDFRDLCVERVSGRRSSKQSSPSGVR